MHHPCHLLTLLPLLFLVGCQLSDNQQNSRNPSQDSRTPPQRISNQPAPSGQSLLVDYSWDVASGKTTITNLATDSVAYLRASSKGDGSQPTQLHDILLPQESLSLPVGTASGPRLNLLFSRQGNSYLLKAPTDSASQPTLAALVIADSNLSYQGQLDGFSHIDHFSRNETRSGDCARFNWLDKFSGSYQLAATSTSNGLCRIHGLTAVTTDGKQVALPELAFYSGDRLAFFGARVSHVSDGDTLHVQPGGNCQVGSDNCKDGKVDYSIRMAEIDTPETWGADQPYGHQATQSLVDLVDQQWVWVDKTDTDRYGRMVASIYLNGLWINAELVRNGSAWWYDSYSDSQLLKQLEQQARDAKRGLWADAYDANRMPPWEWRQLH